MEDKEMKVIIPLTTFRRLGELGLLPKDPVGEATIYLNPCDKKARLLMQAIFTNCLKENEKDIQCEKTLAATTSLESIFMKKGRLQDLTAFPKGLTEIDILGRYDILANQNLSGKYILSALEYVRANRINKIANNELIDVILSSIYKNAISKNIFIREVEAVFKASRLSTVDGLTLASFVCYLAKILDAIETINAERLLETGEIPNDSTVAPMEAYAEEFSKISQVTSITNASAPNVATDSSNPRKTNGVIMPKPECQRSSKSSENIFSMVKSLISTYGPNSTFDINDILSGLLGSVKKPTVNCYLSILLKEGSIRRAGRGKYSCI